MFLEKPNKITKQVNKWHERRMSQHVLFVVHMARPIVLAQCYRNVDWEQLNNKISTRQFLFKDNWDVWFSNLTIYETTKKKLTLCTYLKCDANSKHCQRARIIAIHFPDVGSNPSSNHCSFSFQFLNIKCGKLSNCKSSFLCSACESCGWFYVKLKLCACTHILAQTW